jgi:hypothetical protein
MQIGMRCKHFQHGSGTVQECADRSFILVAFDVDGTEKRVSDQSLSDEDGNPLWETAVPDSGMKPRASRTATVPTPKLSTTLPVTRHRFGIRRY